MTGGIFALTLKSLDHMMLPIPTHVVERIPANAIGAV